MPRAAEPGIDGKREYWTDLGGRWLLRQRTRDIDGELRYLKATEATKAACRARIRDEVERRKDPEYLAGRVKGFSVAQVQRSRDWISPDHTFLEAADIWLARRVAKTNRLSPTSRDTYARNVDLMIRRRGSIGDVPVKDLTTPMLNFHVKQLAEDGLPLWELDESGKRVREIVTRPVPGLADKFKDTAKAILDVALAHGAVPENRALTMDLLEVDRDAVLDVPDPALLDAMRDALDAWWERGQPEPDSIRLLRRQLRKRLARHPDDLDARARLEELGPTRAGAPRDPHRLVFSFWELLCATGMRPGEVLALRPEDCRPHADHGKLILGVRGTIVSTSVGGTHRQDWPKTDASIRDLVVGAPFTEYVEYLVRLNGHTGLLFANSKGRPMQVQNMGRRLRQAIDESGIDPITARGVRKIIATYLDTDEAAQEQLGHEPGSKVTTQHYRAKPVRIVDHSDEITVRFSRGARTPERIERRV